MTFDLTQLSPRGWAVVIVAIGSAIAVPFMRSGEHRPQDVRSTATPVEATASRQISQPANIAANSTTAPHRVTASFQLPPLGSIPTPASSPTSATSKGIQQSSGPDFPDWARKPSLLDSLIESHATSSSTTPEPALRRPTPFRTWSDERSKDDNLAQSIAAPTDRYSPFIDNNYFESVQRQELAQVAWPDQSWTDQQTKEALETNRTSSTELAQNRSQSQVDKPLGSLTATPTTERAIPPQQKPVGASLRSKVVPSRELFIHQPGR